MTAQELIAHYKAVRKRVALPPRRPIVIPPPPEKPRRPVHGEGSQSRYKYDRAGIQTMLDKGYTFVAIADHYGLSSSAVQRYVRTTGLDVKFAGMRHSRLNPHADAIRAMLDRGMTYLEIGDEFDAEQSTIRKWVKKQGWARE